ncbi:MAG: carbohydrate-binding family 9-like protein [Bacteroidota bacterium]
MNIHRLRDITRNSPLETISQQMSAIEKHSLDYTPWASHPYKPMVTFSMSHNNDCIFLKFLVIEKNIRAANSEVNGPVYEDSCVEFFISFNNDKAYYNLEFNCIGTCLAGFGEGRNDRQLLPGEIIKKIRSQAVINHGATEKNVEWELVLVIPLDFFCHHTLDSLTGSVSRANFYKCGDLLPQPHYVTWSNIEAPAPDFHLPVFFGKIVFV